MNPSEKPAGYLVSTNGRCSKLSLKYVKNVFDLVLARYKGLSKKKQMDIVQLMFQMEAMYLSKKGKDTTLPQGNNMKEGESLSLRIPDFDGVWKEKRKRLKPQHKINQKTCSKATHVSIAQNTGMKEITSHQEWAATIQMQKLARSNNVPSACEQGISLETVVLSYYSKSHHMSIFRQLVIGQLKEI